MSIKEHLFLKVLLLLCKFFYKSGVLHLKLNSDEFLSDKKNYRDKIVQNSNKVTAPFVRKPVCRRYW